MDQLVSMRPPTRVVDGLLARYLFKMPIRWHPYDAEAMPPIVEPFTEAPAARPVPRYCEDIDAALGVAVRMGFIVRLLADSNGIAWSVEVPGHHDEDFSSGIGREMAEHIARVAVRLLNREGRIDARDLQLGPGRRK